MPEQKQIYNLWYVCVDKSGWYTNTDVYIYLSAGEEGRLWRTVNSVAPRPPGESPLNCQTAGMNHTHTYKKTTPSLH